MINFNTNSLHGIAPISGFKSCGLLVNIILMNVILIPST